MLVSKPAFRVLGVAECFRKRARKSVIAGVVWRRDGFVDGVYLSFASVGGMDATDAIVDMYLRSSRRDINVIMLNGCIISWFNIADPEKIYERTGIPVICLSYEESEGLEKYIEKYFPGDVHRMRAYQSLGSRRLVYVKPARTYVYVRASGIAMDEVSRILNVTTKSGKVPEPLRVARQVARAVHSLLEREDPQLLGIPL
ncbi:endonuclease dU [Thermofilum pendens]|uniref:UPF0215 protein Tpen_0247 n=1 Tax=Thermofilum pendens (strain DSM 2475 / Hrk 5) TaxID=368408 RepID=A1RWS7_THEPD|nr:DUF99 family protein [Thermofilum pendens]ABL77657.1 protein of unknown function DUF99 [Thermofilum pendens Hrk 5]